MERFFESEIDGELSVALRHGERVRASVLGFEGDRVVLGVFGGSLLARCELELSVGDELELEVVARGDRVELRPVGHHRPDDLGPEDLGPKDLGPEDLSPEDLSLEDNSRKRPRRGRRGLDLRG